MVARKFNQVESEEIEKKPRIVAPFSTQSTQPNTIVSPPPRSHVFRERKVNTSLFRRYYLRGDIPIGRAYNKGAKSTQILSWWIAPKDLDYCHYLPMFFDGLCETTDPYKLFARHGVRDLLNVASDKIVPVIPQLIIPIKNALNTRNKDVITATLKAIQQLLKAAPLSGTALVPYYRQILPIFNLFRNCNVNIGDRIDFKTEGQIGDAIEETLKMLEQYGGPDAFINIKYNVPTYESAVMN